MTRQVVTCRSDDDLEQVSDPMEERQVRRIPVVNEKGAILGIVSMSDVAHSPRSAAEIGEALHDVSKKTPEPSMPRGESKFRWKASSVNERTTMLG
jgi:predicted transcriptional regulator